MTCPFNKENECESCVLEDTDLGCSINSIANSLAIIADAATQAGDSEEEKES